MANTISSIKRIGITERRTLINRMRTTRLRHSIRAMRRMIAAKDVSGATTLLPATYSVIDKAAKQGVIKKNTAARYKSRLVARIRDLQKAA